MSEPVILRPALHSIIHKFKHSYHNKSILDDDIWGSECEDTDDDDVFSVYSDDYISQDYESDEEEEEEEEDQDYDLSANESCSVEELYSPSLKRQRRA